MFRLCLMFIFLTSLTSQSAAYELWLDIDVDGDPSTINDVTWDNTCTVNLVVAPTGESEELWTVDFGLGGSCVECGGVFHYGTDFDLGDMETWTWDCHQYFAGTFDYATCINCPAPTGFHAYFHAESIIDCCFEITEPIVFATFRAWRIATPGCGVPSNLAVMKHQGVDGVWNYIQIGGPALESEHDSWSAMKSLYR